MNDQYVWLADRTGEIHYSIPRKSDTILAPIYSAILTSLTAKFASLD